MRHTRLHLSELKRWWIPIEKAEEFYNSLSEDIKLNLTDAAKVFVLNNYPVAIVEGEVTNIKITYSHDLKLANTILKADNFLEE